MYIPNSNPSNNGPCKAHSDLHSPPVANAHICGTVQPAVTLLGEEGQVAVRAASFGAPAQVSIQVAVGAALVAHGSHSVAILMTKLINARPKAAKGPQVIPAVAMPTLGPRKVMCSPGSRSANLVVGSLETFTNGLLHFAHLFGSPFLLLLI